MQVELQPHTRTRCGLDVYGIEPDDLLFVGAMELRV